MRFEFPGVQNLDLFAVAVTIAGIGILGFVVFFNNRKSITNRTFLVFSLAAIFYGIVNYLSYQVRSPELVLWLLRLVLFSAVWYSVALLHLFYVFPKEKVTLSPFYRYAVLPASVLTAFLTLTPLVFSHIVEVAPVGEVTNPVRGPGIVVFAFITFLLVGGGFGLLVKKTVQATGIEKRQFIYVLVGTLITYSCLIVFNMVLPVAFNVLRFIPYAPLFTFPFVGFTSYAIIKHHLLNTKIIATEILAFVLSVTMFAEVILSGDPVTMLFRSIVFVLVLTFSILLIRSVRREVEQRELLEKLSADLAAANKQLSELNKFKTQLLSLASHQIKSPLAAIKGFVSLLIEGLYGALTPQAKETLEKVKGATDNLVGLINTLLDLRKVEEGRMDYQFARVNLTQIVAGVIDGLSPLATEKKLQLEFRPSRDECFVNADAEKLKQVFQNLVDNAIKYTPSGFVRASLRPEGDFVLFTVEDSGLGMAPELLPQVFEEFVRDERVKKEIKGTGLGLYIARKIVEAHGGRVWAESDGIGRGSRFFVQLKRT